MEETEIARRVAEELGRIGIPYDWIQIDPADADTATFCAKYGYPLDHSGNTIIVASSKEPTRYAACVVAADTRLDVNHTVKRLMGVSRLSFADPEAVIDLTGMAIGGVTVLALPAHLPVYVDAPLMDLDYVILGSGDRSAKIKISPDVFRHLSSISIVPGLGAPRAR